MLAGMLVMALACWAYAIAVALARVRAIILERERVRGCGDERPCANLGAFVAMGAYGVYVWWRTCSPRSDR